MPLDLSALNIGSEIYPSAIKGRVVSVYSKAVNILLPDGYLCTLLKDLTQMSDFGVVVPGLFENSLHTSLKDSEVVSSGGILSDASDSVRIILKDAERWSGGIYPCKAGFSKDNLLEVYRRYASSDGLSPVVTGKEHNIYSRAALSCLDKAGKSADLSPLIGMGIGFTPSGDDFIAGALLYEDLSAGYDRDSRSSVDRGGIAEGIAKTTPGGRTLLYLALKHSYPFYLKEFVAGLCENNKDIDSIIVSSLSHGATSGSDALAGFIWAALRL